MNVTNFKHASPHGVSKLSGWSLKILMLTFVTFLSACDSGGSPDTDDDGLTDAEEATLGTSPELEDTDGDGYTDSYESIRFNSGTNNFLFNPLIADVPKLRVEITTVPAITLEYFDTNGNTIQSGVERANLTSNVVTTSDTSSNSHSVEQTNTVGVEVSLETEVSLSGGVTATGTVKYDHSNATTNESAFSYTKQQSTENQRSLSEYEAFEETSEITETGGTLAVNVQIINDGDISFGINQLVLGSLMIDSLNGGEKVPVANLNLDSEFSVFSATTLGPGISTGNLVFKTAPLDVGTTKTLLRDASGLIVNVVLNEVVDETGVAFAHRETDINALTASVIIDYGNGLSSERYLVATNVDSSSLVSVQDVMTDTLKIPYTVDSNGSLDSIRSGAAANIALKRFWVAVHSTSDGVTPSVVEYKSLDNGFDFNALELKAGDVLNLVYSEDADLDGVYSRDEFFAGTLPNEPDTDFDGLNDYEELNGFELSVTRLGDSQPTTRIVRSNPLEPDTDGDLIDDVDELDKTDLNNIHWITDPNTDDTDGDLLKDEFDPQPTVATTYKTENNTTSVSAEKTNITLGFTIPVFASSTQVEYEVLRQEVDEVTGVTNCPDKDTCYVALVSAGTGTVTDLSAPLDVVINDTTVVGKKYYYRIYLKINGSPAFIAADLDDTTAALSQEMFINIAKLTGIECIDKRIVTELVPARCDSGFPDGSGGCIFGTLLPAITDVIKNDTTCEIYWEIKANGKVIHKEIERDVTDKINTKTFKKGDSILINAGSTPNEMNTIKVPILPNACITIDAAVWEKDDENPLSPVGDYELVHFYQSYCDADFSTFNLNGSTGRMYNATVTESGKNTTTKKVIVDMLFSITPAP